MNLKVWVMSSQDIAGVKFHFKGFLCYTLHLTLFVSQYCWTHSQKWKKSSASNEAWYSPQFGLA
jgi:hypothetical protein